MRVEEPGSWVWSMGRQLLCPPRSLYLLAETDKGALGVIKGTDSPEYLLDSSVTVEGTLDMGVREGRGQGIGGLLLKAAITFLMVAALSAIYTTLR